MKSFRAIIFDVDGVLVDSEPIHCESTSQMLKDKFEMSFSEGENREFLGSTDRRMLATLRERHHLSATVDELIEWRKNAYTELIAKGQPWRSGMVELVVALHDAGYPLGIASCGLRKIIDRMLESGRIAYCFDSVVSGDEITHPKPDPEIYLEATRRLGIETDQCVAIEDTDVGVQSARAAGLTVIAFPNATTRDMDFTLADCIVESAEEIRALLLNQRNSTH